MFKEETLSFLVFVRVRRFLYVSKCLTVIERLSRTGRLLLLAGRCRPRLRQSRGDLRGTTSSTLRRTPKSEHFPGRSEKEKKVRVVLWISHFEYEMLGYIMSVRRKRVSISRKMM